jgi:hypothetical protein
MSENVESFDFNDCSLMFNLRPIGGYGVSKVLDSGALEPLTKMKFVL